MDTSVLDCSFDPLADAQYAFVATLDNVKVLLQLLKAISFKDNANWFVSDFGIKVFVEDSKCVQMVAYVSKNLFDDYILRPGKGDNKGSDDLAFSVNLGTVMECLNMFGLTGEGCMSPQLKICYAGYGNPLLLLLECQGVVTECKVKTREVEDCADFNFSSANILSRIILASDQLKDVMSDVDTSCDLIEFQISQSSLCISTIGSAGDVSTEIPNNGDVGMFECVVPVSAKFKLNLLKHGIKPLGFSERINLRMDDRDFLNLQHMVDTPNGKAFIEFSCAPEEDLPDY